MKAATAYRCLFLAAIVFGSEAPHVQAAESPSFKAYSQGQYMTARKLAETEAAQGSKEAYTLLGEIYAEGWASPRMIRKLPTPTGKGPILAMPTPSSRSALLRSRAAA